MDRVLTNTSSQQWLKKKKVPKVKVNTDLEILKQHSKGSNGCSPVTKSERNLKNIYKKEGKSNTQESKIYTVACK